MLSRLSVAVLTLVILVTAQFAVAGEPPKNGIGLMASLQDDQVDIIVPGWISPHVVIAPAVRLVSVTNGYSDIGIGGIVRIYKRESVVSPYIAARGMALIFSPNRGDGWTDILFGGAVGGDYFIEEHISIGVEAQVNATLSADSSTRFGNPGGTTINSGMGVFAALYF